MPKAVNSQKQCSKCRETKSTDQFSKCRSRSDGFDTYCKVCHLIRVNQIKNTLPKVNPLFKDCSKCKKTKPSEQFNICKMTRSGLSSWCKSCRLDCNLKYYKEHLELQLESHREYRSIHDIEIREYRKKNKEKQAVRNRFWTSRNRLQKNFHNQQRRALRKSVLCLRFSFKQIKERDDVTCQICYLPIESGDLHFDHWIPLSVGGPHCFENVRCTHACCNVSKSDKVPDLEELPNDLIWLWFVSSLKILLPKSFPFLIPTPVSHWLIPSSAFQSK